MHKVTPALVLALSVSPASVARQAIDLHNPSNGSESGYVRIADDPSLEPQTFTIDLTFLPEGPGFGNTQDANGATLFAKPREGMGGVYIMSWTTQWSPQTGKVNFTVSNNGSTAGQTLSSSCGVAMGKRTRMTASFDGVTMRVYLNGVLSAQQDTGFSSVYYGDDDVLIGAGNYCCNFFRRFDGVIDGVSLWGRALSDEEVASLDASSLVGDEADLIGLWTFDDGTLDDGTANGNDGIAAGTGAAGPAVAFVDGVPSQDPCPADFNGDATIGSSDLNVLLSAFGAGGCADIDGDGDTDSGDLNLLLAAFGQGCR